jgi:hypothetical protein
MHTALHSTHIASLKLAVRALPTNRRSITMTMHARNLIDNYYYARNLMQHGRHQSISACAVNKPQKAAHMRTRSLQLSSVM